MANHTYAIYILASTYKHLYIGVTGQLEQRITTHKAAANRQAFTARYRINRLVHIERFRYINNALARETELKSWTRLKKIALIIADNPTWRDLSLDWGTPIPPPRTPTPPPPCSF